MRLIERENQTQAENSPYPITITRRQLEDSEACEEGLEVFDDAAPSGTLVILDVSFHVRLLAGPLAPYEARAIKLGMLPPIVSASGTGGTSMSGTRGTSTSGDRGTSTSGDQGTSTSGDGGTSTSGYYGTSVSGDQGTSLSGTGGMSMSGIKGTSTSGDRGTSMSGDQGTSTSGYVGRVAAGVGGLLTLAYRDGARRRIRAAYVGEDGILPNVLYRLDRNGNFVPACL